MPGTELSFRERRRLGLDIERIRQIRKQLKDSNQIDDEASREEVAAMILSELVQGDQQTFSGPGIDLDQIMKWIELILKLLEFFQ